VEFEIQHDPERTANRMREEFETTDQLKSRMRAISLALATQIKLLEDSGDETEKVYSRMYPLKYGIGSSKCGWRASLDPFYTARDEHLDDEEEDRENRATDDFLEDYFNPGLDWATIFTPVSSTDIPADYREDDSEDDESFDGYHDGEFNETTVSQALVSVPIKDVLDEDRQCSICKEAYGCSEGNMEAPEEPVKLSCGHIFGFVCATAWLYIGSRHQDCPMCRRRR